MPANALQSPDEAEPESTETISHQPEWDRLIRRLRPDWCRVIEQAPAAFQPGRDELAGRAETQQISCRLLAPLRGLIRPMGAALRHATARLGAGRGSARWLLLISDGQPHDVDVHDPRYLVDDARQAVRDAGRRGVRLACLTLAGQAGPEALRIFGRRGTQALVDLNALPRALRRLMA